MRSGAAGGAKFRSAPGLSAPTMIAIQPWIIPAFCRLAMILSTPRLCVIFCDPNLWVPMDPEIIDDFEYPGMEFWGQHRWNVFEPYWALKLQLISQKWACSVSSQPLFWRHLWRKFKPDSNEAGNNCSLFLHIFTIKKVAVGFGVSGLFAVSNFFKNKTIFMTGSWATNNAFWTQWHWRTSISRAIDLFPVTVS